MASTSKKQLAQQASDRERIREFDPVARLIDVARGAPIPRLDIDGNVVAYDTIDPQVRVAAVGQLLKRILPELQSVSIDAESAGVTFVIQSPFPLPGSKRPDADPTLIEGNVPFGQLEQHLKNGTPTSPELAEQTATPGTHEPRKRSF